MASFILFLYTDFFTRRIFSIEQRLALNKRRFSKTEFQISPQAFIQGHIISFGNKKK